MERPLPGVTPETKSFWDGARNGELRLQRCADCRHNYFPPRPFCPKCSSKNIVEFAASGKGSIYSFIISHRPAPGFEAPYSIAVVELDEGPRMMTNIVGCPQTPEAISLDARVEIIFQQQSPEISLPLFKLTEMKHGQE